MKMPSPGTRDYTYKVITAVSVVILTYGVAGPGEIDAWLLVASAVLGVGTGSLASANTDKPGPHDK